ncbi:hypothetical protein ABI_34420 [Asticcacaulis biprosthecium C19]|uniref:Uncharacterized protein n=1 Tax=Asticcacaulis biprosthecium C19 TaxID=715226 RepID=F4QQD4_9CAUL|nr:hypothetical protein ABI_34420 [Asticcacaulis biprosthecium C19]
MTKFTDLGLGAEVLKAIAETGYDTPRPSKNRRFLSPSPGWTSWALPRPAPVKPPPSPCR